MKMMVFYTARFPRACALFFSHYVTFFFSRKDNLLFKKSHLRCMYITIIISSRFIPCWKQKNPAAYSGVGGGFD